MLCKKQASKRALLCNILFLIYYIKKIKSRPIMFMLLISAIVTLLLTHVVITFTVVRYWHLEMKSMGGGMGNSIARGVGDPLARGWYQLIGCTSATGGGTTNHNGARRLRKLSSNKTSKNLLWHLAWSFEKQHQSCYIYFFIEFCVSIFGPRCLHPRLPKVRFSLSLSLSFSLSHLHLSSLSLSVGKECWRAKLSPAEWLLAS